MVRLLALTVCIILTLTACSPGQKGNSSSASKGSECKETPVRQVQLEKNAEEIVNQIKGIDDSVAVWMDDQLSVGIKVTNFNRFRLESLRKDAFQKLKDTFPDAKVHVTSDAKLYKELDKLQKKEPSDEKESACKQKTKLKEIEDLMRG